MCRSDDFDNPRVARNLVKRVNVYLTNADPGGVLSRFISLYHHNVVKTPADVGS